MHDYKLELLAKQKEEGTDTVTLATPIIIVWNFITIKIINK